MSYCTYFYILFISACPTCNYIVRNGCPVGLVLCHTRGIASIIRPSASWELLLE
ncbi:mCG147631 [Mus musculus]|nr:mCG147631 [Mus musculus]